MAHLPPLDGEPKLLIPALEPFYRLVGPISWLIIRLAAGLIMAVHGWPKVVRVIEMIGGAPAGQGSTTRLVILAFFEFFGGLGVAFGLFTRFFAPALAIELLVITIGYWPVFAWRKDGYEYTLLWGLLMFAIALRGPGPYSVDKKLGVTL